MTAGELKNLAEKILQDFQKALTDMSAMSGYVYDKKTSERLERLYNTQIEKIIHERLKQFEEEYIKRLNFLCQRAAVEMKAPVMKNDLLDSKLRFWSTIYHNKPADLITSKYLAAVDDHNMEFIYFVENQFLHFRKHLIPETDLKALIHKNRKARIKKSIQAEIEELNDLYGFYLQSREFIQGSGFDLIRIQKLFNSLNIHFQIPLHELQIYKKN